MEKQMEYGEVEAKKAWNAAVEALGNENVAREVAKTVEWLRVAREMEKTSATPYLTKLCAQREIAAVGARRIEQLRRAARFEEADRALTLTQQYLAFLEQFAQEYEFSKEAFHTCLKHCVQEHTYSLPRAE